MLSDHGNPMHVMALSVVCMHDINRFTRWSTDIHRNGLREDSPYITRYGAPG